MIKRRNILELIGKHRGKYHSCIMTCYSLDFTFFEERILPTLRLANVRNVNILADGHYLEIAQERTTGKEFKHNKTYNFQPVYETGVFHPKIMLLTGVRHGLLIIGSGNITSSGLSTNDEIWSSFHLENLGNENAPLFGAVWKYLQPFLKQSVGFIPQKIEWIRQQSPWLEKLPVTNDWINLPSLEIEIKFIGNSSKASTFSQLINNIPNKEIDELTVISPYYDKTGQQLKQLKEHFSPNQMRCLIDPNSGLIPSELDEITKTQIDFFNWSNCRDDYEELYNRLHAKLFHFKLKDQEYLLLGSGNATIAALGSKDSLCANSEAGVLLKRPIKEQTWIQELNIKIPEKAINLSKDRVVGITDPSVDRMNYRFRVLYAELRANEISIYLNKNCQEEIIVNVLDRNDLPLECILKEKSGDVLVAQVTNSEDVFKLAITQGNNRISNYCLIHRLEALLRCNPDPNQEKLDILLEQDYTDGQGITELLQFVDYNWADEDSKGVKKVFNSTPKMQKAPVQDLNKKYEILKPEEFNKVSAESLLKQSGELANSTVKIAEFLSLYTSNIFNKDDDFNESQEQKLLQDEDQKGEGGSTSGSLEKRTQGSKEKAAMVKYFTRLHEIYNQKLEKFLKTKALTELPKNEITIRSLSSILIALYLIQIKYGKRYTLITNRINENGDPIIQEEVFIPSGTLGESLSSVKGFLLNVLGKFFLLSGAGYKEYEFELLNNKLFRSRSQLLVRGAFLILNTPWRETERIDRDLLLLNCLYFSLRESILNDDIKNEVISKLNDFKNNASFKNQNFKEQLNYFTQDMLPTYLNWLRKFQNKDKRLSTLVSFTSDLNHESFIFNSKLGFNLVKEVIPNNPTFKLQLSRAGYPFNNGQFALSNVQMGKKCITYET